MGEPLAVDLCCGLGGWTSGLLSEGWRVRGYDIEAHEYGEDRYPANLVLRNVLEMHGSEIADADLIVASPPCQEYSYMAMPWSRAKQIAPTLKRGAVKLSAEDKRQHLSSARKAASAMIAKIPLALSSHIARVYRPAAAVSEAA